MTENSQVTKKREYPEIEGEMTEDFRRGLLAAAKFTEDFFAHLPNHSKWKRAATVISRGLKEKAS
jgi:hypothetical protein